MEIKIYCNNCNKKHEIQYSECKLDISINYYKQYNKTELLNEINKYKKIEIIKKTYTCTKCKKIIKSYNNYKHHIQNNVCEKIKLNCEKCMKIFKKTQNLNYHIDNNVCNKNDIEKINNICQNTTNNNITNITNNNNNNNNNNITNNTINNIIISVNNLDDLKKITELIPFRNTKYDTTSNKLIQYLNNPHNALLKMISDIHYNEAKPENCNILNTTKRDNTIKVYDYDHNDEIKWHIKEKDVICDLLYDKCVNYLRQVPKKLQNNGVHVDTTKEFALTSKIMDYENDRKTKKRYIKLIKNTTYDDTIKIKKILKKIL